MAELRDANGKLEGIAVTDSLTGVFNRRAFDLRFEEELRRARRHRAQISLLMADIDHFKKINNAFGHLSGDQCLIAVPSTLYKNLRRPADFLARYGGEVEELQINYEGSVVRLTISIGVSSCLLETAVLADAMLSSADSALYKAKSQGRNQVVLEE